MIKLNGSEDLAKAGKGWGVDWNGDFIFQIEDLPLEKMEKAIKMVAEGKDDELTELAENSAYPKKMELG